jgi:hypothetical protein
LQSETTHQWEQEQNCQNADKSLFWFHGVYFAEALPKQSIGPKPYIEVLRGKPRETTT